MLVELQAALQFAKEVYCPLPNKLMSQPVIISQSHDTQLFWQSTNVRY